MKNVIAYIKAHWKNWRTSLAALLLLAVGALLVAHKVTESEAMLLMTIIGAAGLHAARDGKNKDNGDTPANNV